MNLINDVLEWLYTAKPEWRKRDITDYTDEDNSLFNSLILEEQQETELGIYTNNRKEVLDGICDELYITLNRAAMCGITSTELSEYFTKVTKSNWSKFCKTQQEAEETCILYGKGLHPNKLGEIIDALYKKEGDHYVVFRQPDNKILKSLNFKDVNEV